MPRTAAVDAFDRARDACMRARRHALDGDVDLAFRAESQAICALEAAHDELEDEPIVTPADACACGPLECNAFVLNAHRPGPDRHRCARARAQTELAIATQAQPSSTA